MAACVALIDDCELMLRVRGGDSASFALLLERHRTPVISFLYRMVQNRPVAEELAQEVFLRVYRSRANYEPSARFTTWLYRIALNMALNTLRDGRHSPRESAGDDLGEPFRHVADQSPSIEQTMLHEARLAEVREAIAALPGKQRAAVIMHKYQDMEYSEIARVLGCSESALKSLLFRAYQTLRVRLAHMAPERGASL
jgi:RNA polymerase sigma-70 factor, ECF subfamily